MLRVSSRTAGDRLLTAQRLVTLFPDTLAALAAGEVSLPHALRLSDATLGLGDEVTGLVQAAVLPKAATGRRRGSSPPRSGRRWPGSTPAPGHPAPGCPRRAAGGVRPATRRHVPPVGEPARRRGRGDPGPGVPVRRPGQGPRRHR